MSQYPQSWSVGESSRISLRPHHSASDSNVVQSGYILPLYTKGKTQSPVGAVVVVEGVVPTINVVKYLKDHDIIMKTYIVKFFDINIVF